MPVRVLELHHHAVRAGAAPATVDAVRDFYVSVLGLAVDSARPSLPGMPGYWIDVGDRAQIHLLGVAATPSAPDARIDPRAPHVALAVADVAEARHELERLGIRHVVRGGEGSLPTLFLHDPAGNLIELHQIDTCRCSARSRAAAEATGNARAWGAVMFADMRGFTSLAERLPPAEILPLLNEYFGLLSKITLDHGGTVFHLAGDGLMAGFGMPRAEREERTREAPGQAVASARDMLVGFRALAADWKRRLDVETGLGIGIHAGEVIVGHVGAPGIMNYTLVGDTVNVASRLSQRARAGEALFSHEVKRSIAACGRDVLALEIPALQLRGRAAPIDIWCLPAAERVDFRP
jgi:class 3 adenylate cyclase/catechol 2,3-dioxygenase-like lactoylglutathione lyase family enzyme